MYAFTTATINSACMAVRIYYCNNEQSVHVCTHLLLQQWLARACVYASSIATPARSFHVCCFFRAVRPIQSPGHMHKLSMLVQWGVRRGISGGPLFICFVCCSFISFGCIEFLHEIGGQRWAQLLSKISICAVVYCHDFWFCFTFRTIAPAMSTVASSHHGACQCSAFLPAWVRVWYYVPVSWG
jgi:hypothetical protein